MLDLVFILLIVIYFGFLSFLIEPFLYFFYPFDFLFFLSTQYLFIKNHTIFNHLAQNPATIEVIRKLGVCFDIKIYFLTYFRQ
jgi:hypothetical protein